MRNSQGGSQTVTVKWWLVAPAVRGDVRVHPGGRLAKRRRSGCRQISAAVAGVANVRAAMGELWTQFGKYGIGSAGPAVPVRSRPDLPRRSSALERVYQRSGRPAARGRNSQPRSVSSWRIRPSRPRRLSVSDMDEKNPFRQSVRSTPSGGRFGPGLGASSK